MSAAEHIASGYTVEYVRPADLPAVWPSVYERLASACDRTMFPREIYDACESEAAVMWLVLSASREVKAVLVTRMRDKGAGPWLEVLAMAGKDFKDWAPFMQRVLEDTSRVNDSGILRAYCKPGVARMMRPLGWREVQRVMEFEHGRR